MKSKGLIRIGAAVPKIKVADLEYNKKEIIKNIKIAEDKKVDILVFPELSITGYTCGDLFFQSLIKTRTEELILEILKFTENKKILIFLGAPISKEGSLYNCAIALNKGKILGVVPKTFIPNYNEFYEKRWFASGSNISQSQIKIGQGEYNFGRDLLFKCEDRELMVGVEICEDLWAPISPGQFQSLSGANLIVNLSASNDIVGKSIYREQLISQQSAKCISGYVYSSAGYGESTTDLVFGGNIIIAENGKIIENNKDYNIDGKFVYNDIDVEKINKLNLKGLLTPILLYLKRKKIRKNDVVRYLICKLWL